MVKIDKITICNMCNWNFFVGDEFINRKGYPSINVQATCNAAECFTSVDVSWPGSVHDARIWKRSSVYKIMRQNRSNALLLGDEGYPIAPFLMKVFKNPSTRKEIMFNKLISKERVVIERMFGQLKMRFPALMYKLRVNINIVPKVILSAFILHNVAKYLKDEFIFEGQLIPDNHSMLDQPTDDNQVIRDKGMRRRQQIIDQLNLI